MNGQMELEVFDSITADECCEAECEYSLEVRDPYNTGDNHKVVYECTGSPELCPILAKKVQESIEGNEDE